MTYGVAVLKACEKDRDYTTAQKFVDLIDFMLSGEEKKALYFHFLVVLSGCAEDLKAANSIVPAAISFHKSRISNGFQSIQSYRVLMNIVLSIKDVDRACMLLIEAMKDNLLNPIEYDVISSLCCAYWTNPSLLKRLMKTFKATLINLRCDPSSSIGTFFERLL